MKYQTSSVTLYYETYGEGQPLILLHGNGETHAIFEKAIPILAKQFTVYAIDSRSHGKSSKVEELHYEDMAQDVHEFIVGLQIHKPILYGFSDGGIIGLLMAIKYPQVLSQVIGSGVNINPKGIKAGWLFLFKIMYFFNRSPLFKLMLTEPNITKEMLNTIKIPVDIIGGSKDMIGQKHMQAIADAIPNGTYTVLPGETHGSYVVDNEKLAEVILKTIDESN